MWPPLFHHLLWKQKKGQKPAALTVPLNHLHNLLHSWNKQYHSNINKEWLQTQELDEKQENESSYTCCSSDDRNAPFNRSRAAEGSTNFLFDPIIRANKYWSSCINTIFLFSYRKHGMHTLTTINL
jgi:hypothetical protein